MISNCLEKAMNINRFEKSTMNFDNFKSLTIIFRLLELCFGLICLSWSSTRLPLLIRISGEYLRLTTSFIISPLFIFLLSNSIVLTLLLKSPIASDAVETKIYDSLVQSRDYSPKTAAGDSVTASGDSAENAEIVQGDLTVSEICGSADLDSEGSGKFDLGSGSDQGICEKRRRLATEDGRKMSDPAADVDELSNEEFQRAIEAFIAKQIKFHQEEKLDIVPHQSSLTISALRV